MDVKIDDNTVNVCMFAIAVTGFCYLFKKFGDMIK